MENFNIQVTDLPDKFHPLLATLQHPSVHPLLQSLRPSSTADGIAVALFLLSALGYLTRGRVWDTPDPFYGRYFERPQVEDGGARAKQQASRNIAERLQEENHDAVIFWGSQSGTSERFAEALGRECHTRFGISALVADLSDFDAETIALIPQTKFAIFILSTYGEGDPSDNTAGLWDWIKNFRDNKIPLKDLRYIGLGLGNSNYKYYNRVLDVVSDALDAAGATALLPKQKADDANGATEEDYQSWKNDIFTLLRGRGYEEKTIEYQPLLEIDFISSDPKPEHSISVQHQQSTTNSAILPLAIKSARELFTAGDRNCVHLELDLGHHEVGYKTGDHIGVWPCNPDEEVDRLLEALDLQSHRSSTFSLKVLDDTLKSKIPSPTTLEAVFRHHLEICAPVSRATFLSLAQFAPSESAKATLLEFGQDRARYDQLTANTHITFARLLQLVSPGQPWTNIPLSFVLETLLPLQPRYYSISSSSVTSPRRIAITALVVNKSLPSTPESTIQGLASNYLLSATQLPSNSNMPTPSYSISHASSPELAEGKIYAHIRKSKFKLPITSSTPLILICAGTGFAPFRAFLAERAKLAAIGKPVGKMVLFFGCRSPDSDYIYKEELEKIQEQLGEKLEIVTAFSREQGHAKVYVQDRVEQRGAQILEMLESGASMYICGKAAMAREVDKRLEEAKVQAGMEEADVKAWTDGLKKRGKWRADVWG